MFTQKVSKLIVFTLVALTLTASAAFAVDGWASMNGGTTGGAGGPTVTVTNATDLAYYCALKTEPYIIQIQGTIVCPAEIYVKSNKTLIGLGNNAVLDTSLLLRTSTSLGTAKNVIIQNLTIQNPRGLSEGDGIQLKYNGVSNVWIDHCTIRNTADGAIDVTNESDYVTISWCKFYYDAYAAHNFPNLIGSADTSTADRGKLRVTLHHNWYSSNCEQRMPRVRFGQVHVYNNYFLTPIAKYNIGVGTESQIRVEDNYFDGTRPDTAWISCAATGYTPGKIGWDNGNVFVNTTLPTWAPNDYATIFVPPYSYTTDDGLSVPGIVMAGAGAGGGGPTPTPTVTPTPTPTATPTPTPTGAPTPTPTATPTPTPTATPTPTPGGVPLAPTGLKYNINNNDVALSWNASTGATSYNLKRATVSGGPYATLANRTVRTYTDTTTVQGTTYYYVVSALNAVGESPNSAQITVNR